VKELVSVEPNAIVYYAT